MVRPGRSDHISHKKAGYKTGLVDICFKSLLQCYINCNSQVSYSYHFIT